MKLNEIREIVAFMKDNGVCELEYKEFGTSLRLKLARPQPHHRRDRFCAAERECAPEEVPAEPETPVEPEQDRERSQTAERMYHGAMRAGGAVVDTVKAGASFLKSKGEAYRSAAPAACDEEETPEWAEAPVVGEVPEYQPETPEDPAQEPEAPQMPEDLVPPVRLDTDAAKEAVSRTAEALVNTARAAVELGIAGVRRGGVRLSDLLRPRKDEAEPDAEEAEAAPEADAQTRAEELEGAPAQEAAPEAEKAEE